MSGRCLRASSASSVCEETAQRTSPDVVLFKSDGRVSQRKRSVSLTEWLLRRTSKQPSNSSPNHVMTWWVCSAETLNGSESLNCIVWSLGANILESICSSVCFFSHFVIFKKAMDVYIRLCCRRASITGFSLPLWRTECSSLPIVLFKSHEILKCFCGNPNMLKVVL